MRVPCAGRSRRVGDRYTAGWRAAFRRLGKYGESVASYKRRGGAAGGGRALASRNGSPGSGLLRRHAEPPPAAPRLRPPRPATRFPIGTTSTCRPFDHRRAVELPTIAGPANVRGRHHSRTTPASLECLSNQRAGSASRLFASHARSTGSPAARPLALPDTAVCVTSTAGSPAARRRSAFQWGAANASRKHRRDSGSTRSPPAGGGSALDCMSARCSVRRARPPPARARHARRCTCAATPRRRALVEPRAAGDVGRSLGQIGLPGSRGVGHAGPRGISTLGCRALAPAPSLQRPQPPKANARNRAGRGRATADQRISACHAVVGDPHVASPPGWRRGRAAHRRAAASAPRSSAREPRRPRSAVGVERRAPLPSVMVGRVPRGRIRSTRVRPRSPGRLACPMRRPIDRAAAGADRGTSTIGHVDRWRTELSRARHRRLAAEHHATSLEVPPIRGTTLANSPGRAPACIPSRAGDEPEAGPDITAATAFAATTLEATVPPLACMTSSWRASAARRSRCSRSM